MIPVTLVTGFLGSGKTTFLQHLVASQDAQGVVFLVNEFSAHDVDGRRLELPEGQLTVIAGGSIFCRCKTADFLAVLGQAAALVPPPKAVVIEASGMADPRVFRQVLWETRLDTVFRVAHVVALVDPKAWQKLRTILPAIRHQVAAADLVLINKTDCCPPEQLATVEAEIRIHNPLASVQRTLRAQARCDLTGQGPVLPADPSAQRGRDPRFTQVWAPIPGPVDWPALQTACAVLGDDLYRIKGLVPTGQGLLDVDWTTTGWNAVPARMGGEPGLVLIAAATRAAEAEQLGQQVAAGGFSLP